MSVDDLSGIKSARARLLKALRELDPAEWTTDSLCSGWNVRDVVGHLVDTGEVTAPRFVMGMPAAASALRAIRSRPGSPVGPGSPDALLQRLAAQIARHDEDLGLHGSWLTEVVIHGLDITVPLGRHVPHDDETLLATADFVYASGGVDGVRRRWRGLRFVADDLVWAAGRGREVRGPVRGLLLAMAGRRAGLDLVHGPGVATLQERLA